MESTTAVSKNAERKKVAETVKIALDYLNSKSKFPENQIQEYGRFLLLKVLEKDTLDIKAIRLSPSAAVDEVWHYHKLHPRHYAAMCQELCGNIIDHDPDTAADSNKHERDITTHRTYVLYFGDAPPVSFWGSVLAVKRKREEVKEEKDAQSFTITVKKLTGENDSFEVNQKTTVEELKHDISERWGLPVDDQRLIHKGKQLEHLKTMYSYNVKPGEPMHLVMKLRGC
jgi:hypothetical protein